MKIFNSLYMSALLIVTYVCLDQYKFSLESELSDYNYVLKQISDDNKSEFRSNLSILRHSVHNVNLSNRKVDKLVSAMEQANKILENPILLNSEYNKNLLTNYGLNMTELSGQKTLSTYDIYLITSPFNTAFLYAQFEIEKARSTINKERGFLLVDRGKKNYLRNNQYKIQFQKVLLNKMEKGYDYTISYDGNTDKVFQFPYLLKGEPDSLTIELDCIDQVTGERRYLSQKFKTKDYQL